MQYNLDFLNTGMSFPPVSEAYRLRRYKDHLALYDGRVSDVYKLYRTRITNGDFTTDSFYTELPYFRLVASKTADLVCGEQPDISFGEDVKEDIQEKVKECADIVNGKLRPAVIDFVRFGECVLRPYMSNDGTPKVSVINPVMMIPIVSEEDYGEVQKQVIAWGGQEGKRHVINVQIHENGKYTHRVFTALTPAFNTVTIDGERIQIYQYPVGPEIKELAKEVITGMDGLAIFHIANEPTSDNIHGKSDYEKYSSIIAEMEVRFAQISKILDKHADPNIAAPLHNLSINEETGEITGLKTGGKVWTFGQNGEKPEYITWDGHLDSAYKHIDELQGQLDRLTEMGAILTDNDGTSGGTQGYEALQVKMTNARLKARRISEAFDKPYKDIIKALYQLKYGKPLIAKFSVIWNDGLPNDDLRDAQIASVDIASGRKSRKQVRMEYDGMTSAMSDEIEAQRQAEQPAQTFEVPFA